MMNLIFATDSDVVKICEGRVQRIIFYQFIHLSLEDGNTISYTKGKSTELVKYTIHFECSEWFIFITMLQ